MPCVMVILAGLSVTAGAQTLENPTKLYTGAITSTTGEAITHGLLHVFEEPYPEPILTSKVGENGYRVLIDPAELYRFRVEAPGYYTFEVLMTTPNGFDYREVNEPFILRPIPQDTVLASGQIFSDDTDELIDGVLQPAFAFMIEQPHVEVTMSVGLVEDAVDPLTKQRVAAIKSAFRAAGIDLVRLEWHRDLDRPFGQYSLAVSGFSSS